MKLLFVQKLNDSIKIGVSILALLIALLLAYNYMLHTYFIWDGAHYILMGRMFWENGNIYNDMHTSYTPVGTIIYGILYLFIDTPPFIAFHSIQHLFVFSCGVAVFLALKKEFTNIEAVTASCLTVLIFITHGTKDVKLEAFYIFFLLISFAIGIHSTNKKEWFFTGFFFSLAYLSKQFALLGLPALILIIYLNEDEKRNLTHRIFTLLAGFLIPLSVVVTWFVFIREVPVPRFLHVLFPINPLADKGYISAQQSFQIGIFTTLKYMLWFVPFLIPAFIMFIRGFSLWRIKNERRLPLVFLLAAFSFIPLIILGPYHQYYIPVSMFSFLFIFTYLIKIKPKEIYLIFPGIKRILDGFFTEKIFPLLILFIVFMPALVHGARSLRYHINNTPNHREVNASKEQLAQRINKIVPKNSRAIIDGNESIAFLSNFLPASPGKLSTGFARNFYGENILQLMAPGSFIIIRSDRMYRYEIKEDANFTLLGREDDYYIFVKGNE